MIRFLLCLMLSLGLVEAASAQGRIVARRGSTIQINNGVGGGQAVAAASFRAPSVAFRGPARSSGAAFLGHAATFDVGRTYGIGRGFFPSYASASFFPGYVSRSFFPSYAYPSASFSGYVQSAPYADPGCVQGGGTVTYAPREPDVQETTTTTTTTITRTLIR